MLLQESFTDLKLIDKIIKFIPLVSSIVIFSFGYLLKVIDEKRKILREIKSIQSFCHSWLQASKRNMEKLNKSITEYSEHIDQIDNRPKNLDRYNLMLDKITEIKSVEIYNAFVTNKSAEIDYKTNLFFAFYNHLNVINSNYENLEKIFNAFKTFEDEILEKWIKLDIDFRQYRGKYNPLIDENIPDYIMFIIKCYMEFYERIKSISGFMEVVINPFKESSNDYFKKYPKDDNLIELLHLCDDIDIIYKRWINTRKIFSKSFKETIVRINNSYANLNKTTNDIQELKFKNILCLK
ncbi:MAG: hypothetical protein JWN78_1827 [Bacteroidota bacterium]|nr:hypothetical protein [Bacteroidota bacterium]